MKQFQHGFVIGKFMPLHAGHQLVIDTAIEQCERVTVCLLSRPDDEISADLRYAWLTELYGATCTITHHSTTLPQDETGYGHWDQYLTSIRQTCPEQYDAVFSSETYGKRLAADLGATHVLVDEARMAVPVSGTAIRANPHAHYRYLPVIVQAHYETTKGN